MVNNRRSQLEIINQILVISKNGAKKTCILYNCNLSYKQLEGYLSYMTNKNILEESMDKDNGNNGKVYRPTEKGLIFLEDSKRILEQLS